MYLSKDELFHLTRSSEWLHNEDCDTKTDTRKYNALTAKLDKLYLTGGKRFKITPSQV